jgi:hypothetical protein
MKLCYCTDGQAKKSAWPWASSYPGSKWPVYSKWSILLKASYRSLKPAPPRARAGCTLLWICIFIWPCSQGGEASKAQSAPASAHLSGTLHSVIGQCQTHSCCLYSCSVPMTPGRFSGLLEGISINQLQTDCYNFTLFFPSFHTFNEFGCLLNSKHLQLGQKKKKTPHKTPFSTQ